MNATPPEDHAMADLVPNTPPGVNGNLHTNAGVISRNAGIPPVMPEGLASPPNNLGMHATVAVGGLLNIPPAGEFVTVITSTTGHRLTKRIERNPDGGFKIGDYDEGATWFRFEYVEIANLGELAQVIAGLTQYQAIVPG